MTIRATFLCAALWTVAVAAATPPPPASGAFADIRSRIDSLAGIRSQPAGEEPGDMTPSPAGDGVEAQTEEESDAAALPDASEPAESGDASVPERSADSQTEDVGEAVKIAGEAEDAQPTENGDGTVSASPEDEQPAGADAGAEMGVEKPAAEIGEEAEHKQPAEQTTVEAPPLPAGPKTVCVVYPDMPKETFRVEEWAAELAESGAEEGEHVRNGWTLVVVRMAWSGSQTFRRLTAKRRAMDILREHHPELPAQFKATTRILVDVPQDDGTFTFVQAFRL